MYACIICGNTSFELTHRDEVFKLHGRHMIVENVPAYVCSRCGNKTVSTDTIQQIRSYLEQAPPPTKTVSLDVYSMWT